MHYTLRAMSLQKTQYWNDIVIKQVQLVDADGKSKAQPITQELLEKIRAWKVVMEWPIENEKNLF